VKVEEYVWNQKEKETERERKIVLDKKEVKKFKKRKNLIVREL
jgi:hypothetical protein